LRYFFVSFASVSSISSSESGETITPGTPKLRSSAAVYAAASSSVKISRKTGASGVMPLRGLSGFMP
jgi:hypothetical protein